MILRKYLISLQWVYCIQFNIFLKVVQLQGYTDQTVFPVQIFTVSTVTQRRATVKTVNLGTTVSTVNQVRNNFNRQTLLQILKHAFITVARFGSVRLFNGTVHFVYGAVPFVNVTVRFVNDTVRFVNCAVRFLHGTALFLYSTLCLRYMYNQLHTGIRLLCFIYEVGVTTAL